MNEADTLKGIAQAGGSISLNEAGQLDIDFGEAEVAEGLIEAIREHADALKAYLPRLKAPSIPSPADLTVNVRSTLIRFVTWTPFDHPLTGEFIAFDIETVVEELDNPAAPVPDAVVGVATDGKVGYFIRPADLVAFIEAHPRATLLAHNAPFDLEVTAKAEGNLGTEGIVWQLLNANRVVDTQELEKLVLLGVDGITPPPRVSLAALGEKYLGQAIEKEAPDIDGQPIRTAFGKYAGKDPGSMPEAFLEYAAADAVATILIHRRQMIEVGRIRRDIAPTGFGYQSPEALQTAWERFGPLSVNIQTKAAWIARVLWRRGVAIDRARVAASIKSVEAIRDNTAESLRADGFFVTAPGQKKPAKEKALPTAIRERVESAEADLLKTGKIDRPFPRTPSGQLQFDAEARADIAAVIDDAAFGQFATHEQAKRFLTFLEKLDTDRVHPKFQNLKATGRFSCENPNVQQMPKCGRAGLEISPTIRQAMVPAPGHVFAVVDVNQLEGRSLAAVWRDQMGFGDNLAKVVEAGVDIHTALATELHGREPAKQERSRVKPLTFGYPGGCGVATLIGTAKAQGVELTEEQVRATIEAYKRMAPELEQHLSKTRDTGALCRRLLGIKSKNEAWQLLNTIAGRPDTTDEETIADHWEKAQAFAEIMPSKTKVDQRLIEHLRERKASSALVQAVRRRLCQEAVVTASGRVRASTSFTESRNGVFQGSAADAAILACWELIRAGFDVQLFVHDEVVVEIPDDEHRDEQLAKIGAIINDTISETLGGIPCKVEGYVSRSWSTLDTITDPPKAKVEPVKPAGPRRMLKGTVAGYAKRKPPAEKMPGRKSWQQKVEGNDFDDGDLPF